MKNSKKGMTLVEVVIAIAIFAILAVMTTGVFSTAFSTNRKAQATNKSSLEVQSKIEQNTPISGVDGNLSITFNTGTVSGDISTKTYKNGTDSVSFETFEAK